MNHQKQSQKVLFLVFLLILMGIGVMEFFIVVDRTTFVLSSIPDCLDSLVPPIPASIVIGQVNMNNVAAGTVLNTLDRPFDVQVSPLNGKVMVVDQNNNRVLRFPTTALTMDGAFAELQFFGVTGTGCFPNQLDRATYLSFDSFDRCWVSDTFHNRVLRFDSCSTVPTTATPQQVLGQPGFGGGCNLGTNLDQMNKPVGVYAATDLTLWIVDNINHRILKFPNAQTLGDGGSATMILGVAGPGGCSVNELSGPVGVHGDSNDNLFVADLNNDRVAWYRNVSLKPPSGNIDLVFGQTSLAPCNTPDCSRSSFKKPAGVHIVSQQNGGTLYVADSGNDRVMVWSNVYSIVSNGADASYQIGQNTFTSCVSPPPNNAFTLSNPRGLCFDSFTTQSLIVASFQENRVLRYCGNPSTSNSQSSSNSQTNSNSPSNTASNSNSNTNSQSTSSSSSNSQSSSSSLSISESNTQSQSNSQSQTITNTQTNTVSSTPSISRTSSLSIGASSSSSLSVGVSFSSSLTSAPSSSNSRSIVTTTTSSLSIGASSSSSLSVGSSVSSSSSNSQSIVTTTTSSLSVGSSPSSSETLQSSDSQSSPISSSPSLIGNSIESTSSTQSKTISEIIINPSDSNTFTPSIQSKSSTRSSSSKKQKQTDSSSHSKSKSPPPKCFSTQQIELKQNGKVVFELNAPCSFSDKSTIELKQVPSSAIKQETFQENDQQLLSEVIEITTKGKGKKSKTTLTQPAILCFKLKNNNETTSVLTPQKSSKQSKPHCKKENETHGCLGFSKNTNQSSQFECVDNQLNKSRDGSLVCGTTPHLSTFAILLQSGQSSECETSPYFWASIAILLCVILTIVIFMIVEWRVGFVKRFILGEEGVAAHDFRNQIEETKKQAKINSFQE